MITLEVVDAARMATTTAELAGLLERAYPKDSILMQAPYLRWALTDRDDVDLPARGVVAWDGDSPVGFAGASPTVLVLGGQAARAHIVSFVAVAPGARGRGLAKRLYQELLQDLAARDDHSCVLTYAQEGSLGAELVLQCYPGQGWAGRELEPMPPWGIARRRIAPDTRSFPPAVTIPHELRLATDPATAARHSADPRVVAVTATGMRVLRQSRIGEPESVMGAVDTLPSTISVEALRSALVLAADTLPLNVELVMAPNVPMNAAPIARAAGLRRLPGAAWRAWVWSTDPDHPFLNAARSGVPVT